MTLSVAEPWTAYAFWLRIRRLRGRQTSSTFPLLSKVVILSYPKGVGYCKVTGWRTNWSFLWQGSGARTLGLSQLVTSVWGVAAAVTAAETDTTVPGYGGGGFVFLIWISTDPSMSVKGGKVRGMLGFRVCACSPLLSPGSVVGGGIWGRRWICCNEIVG